MRCLSCGKELSSTEAKVFEKVLVCGICHEMATSMLRKLEADHARLWERTKRWLQQHMLKGGLVRERSHDVHDESEVRQLRSGTGTIPPEDGEV